MKINFVNPPRTCFDRSEIAPPLGLLRLAGAGLAMGAEVILTDFNVLYHTDARLSEPGLFYITAIQYLIDNEADVYCFTSMAVDTHVAVHLSRLLREACPEAVIIAGGTHFGAIAFEVVNAYQWIDFVVTGEGEEVIRRLPSLLREKKRGCVLSGTPVTAEINEGLQFPLVDPDLYFRVNDNRSLDFESGRGCRFRCSFCYSPDHYNGFRNFAEDIAISDLSLARELGFRNVFFVEDNFLNDPVRAGRLCEEIEQARLGLRWHCYVTFPQLLGDTISAMANAGCVAVFAGIDAVGRDSRRVYRKAFVRESGALRERITDCVDNGITPTCAFLLSPSSRQGGCDLEETLYFALVARNAGAHVRLNTFTLYNREQSALNSPIPVEYDEFKVRLMLDVPDIVETNPYAVNRPELFPFHSRYVGREEWHDFVSLSHCLFTLFEAYPETLKCLWDKGGASPVNVAYSILENTGRLLDIPKIERRDTQLLEAIKVLERLSLSDSKLQVALEKESASILSVHSSI